MALVTDIFSLLISCYSRCSEMRWAQFIVTVRRATILLRKSHERRRRCFAYRWRYRISVVQTRQALDGWEETEREREREGRERDASPMNEEIARYIGVAVEMDDSYVSGDDWFSPSDNASHGRQAGYCMPPIHRNVRTSSGDGSLIYIPRRTTASLRGDERPPKTDGE